MVDNICSNHSGQLLIMNLFSYSAEEGIKSTENVRQVANPTS